MGKKLEFSQLHVKINRSAAIVMLLAWSFFCHAATAQSSGEESDYFGRADEICRDIENVVGLKFKQNVRTEVQAPDGFKDYLKKSMDRELGRQGADNCAKAMMKLGVLERPVDLYATYQQLMQSQALAYYDPEKKTFFLLMTNMPAMFFDPTASHELCHALQDQYHNLYEFLGKDVERMRDNGDAAFGKQALVEGEATLVMTIWMIMKQSGTDKADVAEYMSGMALRLEASMEINGLIDVSEARMSDIAPDAEALISSMKDLKNAPRIITDPMIAAYISGGVMVDTVRAKGGWQAVEALYDKPPASSEQVLHPEKIGADAPIDVRLPELTAKLSKDWQLLEQDVAGELGMRVFFRIWQPKEAQDAFAAITTAAGWGGDRYYYFENKKTGKDMLVWKTVWDSEQDAAKYSAAYRTTLPARFPALNKADRSGAENDFKYQIWEVEPGRFLKLAAKGKVVGIIDTTDRGLLDLMWK